MFGQLKTTFYAEYWIEGPHGEPIEEGKKLFVVLMTIHNEGPKPVSFGLGDNDLYGVKFVFEKTPNNTVHYWDFALINGGEFTEAGFSTPIPKEDNLSKIVVYDRHSGKDLIVMTEIPPLPPHKQGNQGTSSQLVPKIPMLDTVLQNLLHCRMGRLAR